MTRNSATRTAWRAKLEKPDKPRIVDVPLRMQKTWGTGKMLIATPRLIEAIARRVPKRKLTTVSHMMGRLARDHHCDSTCPMTTGIFLRIVAEVSEEDLRSGKRRVAPYWRVLRSDGALNSKYPGGVRHQATYLRKEGHQIERRKGGRAVVKDFQNHLVSL